MVAAGRNTGEGRGALEAVVAAGDGQEARGRVQAELLEDVLGLRGRDGRGRSKLSGRLPGDQKGS